MIYGHNYKNAPLEKLGGKGKSLYVMIQNGLNVPEFFVISGELYNIWVNELGGVDSIRILENNHILNMTLLLFERLNIKAELIKHIEMIRKGEDALAIRSSGNVEDGKLMAFPGIFSTKLNIKNIDNVLISIINCYLSVFNERVDEYLRYSGCLSSDIEMSIVIQKMIRPDTAGVMFTCDTSRRRQYITLIEAVYGLGEGLVNGKLTPDLYEVNNKRYIIQDKQIRTKAKKFESLIGIDDIEMVSVQTNMQNISALSDENIIELARIGSVLEDMFLGFQDIEWVIVREKIYILQSRPLVTSMIYRKT